MIDQHAPLADDIDRLRARVAELEAQLAQWQELMELASVLVVDIDAQGGVRYLNPVAERVFHVSRTAYQGKSLLAFIVEADRAPAQQAFAQAIQQRASTLTLECRVSPPHGEEFHSLWSIALRYDAHGQYIGAAATAYDIRPIRQAQQKAEASQAMLQLVIDSLPQAVFWKDRELRYLGANRRMLEDAGLTTLADLIGKSDTDMPWIEQAAAYQADDSEVMRNGPKRNIEEPLTRADGATIWLRTNKIPLWRDGEVIGVLGMYEDITEERRQADALLMFKFLLDHALDGILVVEQGSLRITYANHAMATLLGYSSLEGMSVLSIVPAERIDEYRHLTQRMVSGEKLIIDVPYRHRNGSVVMMQTSALAIHNQRGEPIGIAAISRDMSERVRLEEERRQMQEQIIAAQQAMLRELSTPLLPIADQVVAMPIIGAIDSTRAAQIMETLLEGVARYRAKIAILDITGVRVVDTQVAGALIRAAQAARLLGARVIVSGIGPEVAQTLVHIGAELGDTVPKPNLQEGIAFALSQRNGYQRVR